MRLLFVCLAILTPFGAAAQTIPPIVGATPSTPETPRAELLREARDAKKDVVHDPQPSTLEKWIAKVEPFVMNSPVRSAEYRRGFYPKFGGVARGGGWAVGPGYRYEGLADGELDVDVFARMSWKRYWQLEGRLRMPRLNGGDTAIGVFGRVRDMPQEDFFGFGPDSARESRVSYGLREVAAGGFAEHRLGEGLHAFGRAEYIVPSTRAGSDENYPSIEQLFDTSSLPGFVDAPSFAVVRAGAAFDRTDDPGNPRRGPQYRAEIARWQARSGAPSTFNEVHADLRQFIPFFHKTRVIALRAAVWDTDPVDGDDVPLYYQPVLGGGRALRGYREFRFRDRSALLLQAEYRYNLLPGADGVVFYEAGTVGPSLGDLGSLKTDYGIGVRLGSAQGVFMRIEGAFGTPESPRFYVKFSNAF